MKIEFPYPFQFSSRPAEFINIANGTSWDPITYAALTNQQLDKSDSYRLVTYKQPDKDMEITMSLLVVGRWK